MTKQKVFKNHDLANSAVVFLVGAVLIAAVAVSFFFGAIWAGGRGSPFIPVTGPSSPTAGSPDTQPTSTLSAPTLQPTETPRPSATSVPTETPTNTPEPTATFTSTPTATNQPEEWARFISDVTVADGTFFGPRQTFEKSWRIKNIGETTWTKDYDLVFVDGEAMTKTTALPLPYKIEPGESINLSVKMTAPNPSGEHVGRWMLRNAEGEYFGVGAGADQPLIVKILVLNVDPDASYDFILNMCEATWWNGAMEPLRCPSPLSNTRGFVTMLPGPALENGSNDRPVIWVRPNGKVEGFTAGKYPAYHVEKGDHFLAQIGCLSRSGGCKLTFKLQYQIGKAEKVTLAEWNQVADGNVTKIKFDLSELEGQDVQFILRVIGENKNFENQNGFWLMPRIVNVK